MYGFQSRCNTDVRVVGQYGTGDQAVYRDLYIPYALNDYYQLYKSAPERSFSPPRGTFEIGLYGTHCSTTVPRTPIPPLALHPDVPPPYFDIKVEKFHDNLLNDQNGMKSYAAYFAKKYPNYLGMPITAVYVDQYRQNFIPIDEARKTGIFLEDKIHIYPLVELLIKTTEVPINP